MPAFNSLKEKQIPNRANVLDVFYATDSHKLFIGLGDGSVVCLNDLLTFGPPARCIGPDGPAGAPCVCRNGKDGRDGRDAVDGKPGRDGIGIAGPQGARGTDGAPGRDAPQRSELDNLLIETRRENAALRSAISTLKAEFQALLDADKRSGEYIDFLRAKAAARTKSL